jgi:hypothetical protein
LERKGLIVSAITAVTALLVLAIIALFYFQAPSYDPKDDDVIKKNVTVLTVNSTAFNNSQRIPDRYTCKGSDISPPLTWKGIPSGTSSIALICDDPDAPSGTFVHWVLYDIPGNSTGLPENIPGDKVLNDGSVQGKNGFGTIGYRGPCPPSGKQHRYYFKVYALNTTLKLQPGASKNDVVKAMQGHILAEGKLIGVFSA